MILPVLAVKPLPQVRLWLCFHDGVQAAVDLSGELWGPMFEPLQNPELFAQVKVDPELETVVWPNVVDLALDCLDASAQQACLPGGSTAAPHGRASTPHRPLKT